MSRLMRLGFLALVLVVAITPALADPAIIITDSGCTLGWIGCPVEDAIPLGDGSYTCGFTPSLGIVTITGSNSTALVDPNDQHGNWFFGCQGQIDFGQANPTGVDGSGGDVIAVDPGFFCHPLLFPDACQGNGHGAVIINTRTIGEAAACVPNGILSTLYQQVVAPNGRASATCFLPDPPQGN
jgi:hypothetical protein